MVNVCVCGGRLRETAVGGRSRGKGSRRQTGGGRDEKARQGRGVKGRKGVEWRMGRILVWHFDAVVSPGVYAPNCAGQLVP
jgi:hypothetical protein